MPRIGRVRRLEATARSDAFAIRQPKMSAHITTAALTKVGDIRIPMGTTEAWQLDAAGFYEVVGEVAYVIDLTAKTLAACDIRPVEVDEEVAPGGWKETDNAKVNRVWKALVPPRGGKPEMYRKASQHLQIFGESFLVGTSLLDSAQRESGIGWEFLSPEEIKVEGGGSRVTIKRTFGGYGGMQPIELPDDTYIARLWRSDPRFSERPSCSLKHVLPICREVVVLTQLVDAISKSRLSAGILFVPDEMSFGPNDETEEDSEDTDDVDPFTEELVAHLTAPVEDRTSAASLVPLIMRGPAEFFDKVKLIDVARDLDNLYMDLREEALTRLATGLDVPPEIMTGKGGLNHWSSYNVDADFITKHVSPMGEMLAEFLTSAYLRPMLVAFEDMSEEEAAKYSLRFDASKITSRTDAGPNARAAYDRREISAVTYLRENGFDESDAPDEDEKMERDLRSLMAAEPIVFGPQVLGMLYPELEGKLMLPVESTEPPNTNPNGRTTPGPVTDPTNEPVVDGETGQDEPTPRGQAGPRDEAALISKIAFAADEALQAARERAGTRLLASMKGEEFEELKDSLNAVPVQDVISLVSERDRRHLRVSESDLFAGAWDNVLFAAQGWIREFFLASGDSDALASERSTVAVTTLAGLLELKLQESLVDPPLTCSNGLRVPDDLIERAIEHAKTFEK